MAPYSYMQFGSAAFIVFACFQILKKLIKRAPGHRLPPGPKPLPIIGNFFDLPPNDEPEFLHWFKHKDLYGPISSVTVMGQTLVIFHDRDAAHSVLNQKGRKTSARPRMNFATLAGFENFLITHQYHDTYRLHRRMVHQEIGTKSLSARFQTIQEREALQAVLQTFDGPDSMMVHLKT